MAKFRVHHVRFFEYEPKAIHCIAYEKGTERVAVSRSDGSIEIWSIKDDWYQEKVIAGSPQRSVEAVVWCGRRLFTGGLGGDIEEYDLLRLEPLRSVSSNAGAVWCLIKNSSQTKLAAGTEDGCVVLFSITGENVEYEKSFGKQEGRILSLAWHPDEELIVTGGVDNIRIWSVHSGHAIQRLTMRRQENNKETIVWSVAFMRDMTIISGDSRGKTSFWNGKQGTLIKSFQGHRADVLTVCVNEEENSVFSSGVDPTLVEFEYIATQPDSDWKTWVRSTMRFQHTHDVRALSYARNCVISGGVDTSLVYNLLERKSGRKCWRKMCAIPHSPLVAVAKDANIVVLNYSTYLELWKLGSTDRTSDKNGEILSLRENALKLLQLKTKNAEAIVCFDVSSDGSWISYSDAASLTLYRLTIESREMVTPQVSLEKVKLPRGVVARVHKVAFTADGRRLIVATCEGHVQVLRLDCDIPYVQHCFPYPTDKVVSIHLLAVSPDGKYAASGNHDNGVAIYDVIKNQHVCNLPRYHCQASALAFNPQSTELVVAYTDQKVLEYDVERQEYTSWCRRNLKLFHPQWLMRHSKISHVTFNPANNKQIILHDEQMLCVLDKSQPFPSAEVKLYSRGAWQYQGNEQATSSHDHAFHICNKYKYLLYVEALNADWLMVVERPSRVIADSLPQTLKQKKFGT